LVCRGLIVDRINKNIIALPVSKFFNYLENGATFKNLPYTIREKMDGSLGIIWHFNGEWNCSTRGSFSSDQAIKCRELLIHKYPLTQVVVDKDITLCVEVIYPSNRIVVDYKNEEKLVLLAAFNRVTFQEYDDDVLEVLSKTTGLERPKEYHFQNFLELEESVKNWPQNQEGVVIKFSDGSRIKLKSENYKIAHRAVSMCSPLSAWESAKDNLSLDFVACLPDEFQEQYLGWIKDFNSQAQTIWDGVIRLYDSTKHLSDKELGLKNQAKELGDYGGMVFAIRKNGADLNNKKARNWVFESFKPKGNVLKKVEE
jgi:RNA ligase